MTDFESPLFIRLVTKQSNILERMLSTPSHFRPEAIKLAEYALINDTNSPVLFELLTFAMSMQRFNLASSKASKIF
ncbi:MAG: hypothetical protein ABJK11_13985 [Balneola sp.]